MFGFFNKTPSKRTFDSKILRKNNISLLMLDERWNSLFANIAKTPEILKSEEQLKGLLKEQARLTAEQKEVAVIKKGCMDKILKLTTEVFENNNQEAKKEMQECEKEIKRINERVVKIEERLEGIPGVIKEVNLALLEHTVYVVYFKIKENRKRVKELEALIEETHIRLREYIDIKESLAKDDGDIYTYFHDLIGAEELERLDREYFGEVEQKTEDKGESKV